VLLNERAVHRSFLIFLFLFLSRKKEKRNSLKVFVLFLFPRLKYGASFDEKKQKSRQEGLRPPADCGTSSSCRIALLNDCITVASTFDRYS